MAPFTFTIVINNSGTGFTIPLFGTNITFIVDWGDGTTGDTSNTHTYANAGTYNVSAEVGGTDITLCGDYGSWNPSEALVSVTSFGSMNLVSLFKGFQGCNNLTNVPTTLPSSVTNLGVTFGFGPTSFNQNINSWNTTNVVNMKACFAINALFNQPLNNWNTSNVTDMNNMFNSCNVFNQNIGNWNTSNVTDMGYMFYFATIFNQNLGNWNISNVNNFSGFMNGCFGMSISNFNSLLNGWATRSVQPSMYLGASGPKYNSGGLNGYNILRSSPNFWYIDTQRQQVPNIVFTGFTKSYNDDVYTISTSSDSTGAITFSSSNTAIATVSSNVITVKGPGSFVITANQAGTGENGYDIGSQTFNFTINASNNNNNNNSNNSSNAVVSQKSLEKKWVGGNRDASQVTRNKNSVSALY